MIAVELQSLEAADVPVVHVVSGHPEIGGILSLLVQGHALSCAFYNSIGAFFAAARTDAPGCLLLDIRLADLSGVDFMRLVSRNFRGSVVFFTVVDGQAVRAVVHSGASGEGRVGARQDLIPAVFAALEADRRVRARAQERERFLRAFVDLTPREKDILALVASGQLNKQVAVALNLSEVTVKVYRSRIMKKMGADSLAELVRMASALESPLDEGIVPSPQ